MKLKSYFVQSMEEALQAAKRDLGDEAMLVRTKPLETAPGNRVRLEVVFATTGPTPPPVVAEPAPAPLAVVAPARDVGGIRAELRNLIDVLAQPPDARNLSRAAAEREKLRGRLLYAEVPAAVADSFLEDCPAGLAGVPLIERLASAWARYDRASLTEPRRLLLAGPAGAGKSTMIGKLAFRYAVTRSQPVTVISVDNLRIGASDALGRLCALIGVPFLSLDSSVALPAAVQAVLPRSTVLIDTPGFGPRDADLLEETASHAASVSGLECQLVLPATMPCAGMERQRRRYEPFRPSRLLPTRLDEAEFLGPLWAFGRMSGLAAEWISVGPGVPEDVEDADPFQIAEAVLTAAGPLPAPVAAAKPTSPFASAAGAGGTRI